jgi:hypothetical protein
MMVLGILILAALVVCGAIAYFSVMLALGVLLAIFWFWAVVIALVTRDPYVGFFGAFVATAATGLLISRYYDRKDDATK